MLPIKEQITQAIVAALKTIVAGATYTREDGTTGTYQITLAGVERPKMRGDRNIPGDLKCVLHEGDDRPLQPNDAVDSGGGPIQHHTWWRPYSAQVFVADNNPAMPFNQRANLVSSDVLSCLLTNRQWVIAGVELADDTFPRGTNTMESLEDIPFVEVYFEIQYRTAENNPYSL